MEDKNTIKVSLSTVFLIIAIIVIIIMGMFMLKTNEDKANAEEKVENLNGEVSDLKGQVSDLQGKINSISKTINSNSSNTTNISDESNDNKTSTTQLSTEDTIKELFLAKLKGINNSNSEKLLDYRVDKVEILNNNEKQSLIELGYTSNDILAYVTYSVKPKNVNASAWIAGNGEVEGDWITNKVANECLRNGKLVNSTGFNTGW